MSNDLIFKYGDGDLPESNAGTVYIKKSGNTKADMYVDSPETKSKVMEYCSLTGSAQFFRSVVSDSCDPMNRSTPGLPIHH